MLARTPWEKWITRRRSIDAVAPQPGDVVLIKKRVSAFSGSDLDVVLRSLGIESLVLTGIATSGVVLSTLREAADLDFILTVLSDGCLDRDAEVHRVLMEKIFPRQASVMSAAEWKAHISASTKGSLNVRPLITNHSQALGVPVPDW